MNTKSIALLAIAIILIGLTGAASAYTYSDFGTVTPGYYTDMVYNPDNLQTIELPFGEITPGYYTEMFYNPPGCTPITSNTNVGSTPPSTTPEVGVPIPGLEERMAEVREVPEAYSLREDLNGTSIPGPYTQERFGP